MIDGKAKHSPTNDWDTNAVWVDAGRAIGVRKKNLRIARKNSRGIAVGPEGFGHHSSMRKRRTILVVGDSFCDVNAGPLPRLPEWGRNVVSPERILAQPGGAALNVACNLQRLRGDTALYSGIGEPLPRSPTSHGHHRLDRRFDSPPLTRCISGPGRDAFGDMLRVYLDSLGVRLIEARSGLL